MYSQKYMTRIFRPVVIDTLLKAMKVWELSHPFNLEFRCRYFGAMRFIFKDLTDIVNDIGEVILSFIYLSKIMFLLCQQA